ncbi:CPBP family intramembrane glutamic endopeptidase [Oceanitalea stevensii]|uniref:CPBP family intramembrane metalloprotease n=1 Tax=Oceanitalea stevensii TaxID=2763072 RepID=A0ABR8YYI0_9MICO|nr:CPBP family intramembrane glutamic endopeptidase [Oceanitalea stevensii]MBD8061029.1 CPBP family intramembrane metalloprotease [Oceanitalea stevensii]
MVWVLGPATATVAGTLLGLLPRPGPLSFLRLHAGLLLAALVVGIGVAGIGPVGRAGSVDDDGGGWLGLGAAAAVGDGGWLGLGRAAALGDGGWLDLGGLSWPLALVAFVAVGGLGGLAAIWAYDRIVRVIRARARGGPMRPAPGTAPRWAWASRPPGTPARSSGPGSSPVSRPLSRASSGPAAVEAPRPATVTGHLVACAVLEELAFRGLLVWAALAVGGVGGAAALVAVTVLFALSHAELGPGQPLAFLPLSVIALALVLLTGSMLPAVTAHVVVNVRAGVAAGRQTGSRVPAGGWAR